MNIIYVHHPYGRCAGSLGCDDCDWMATHVADSIFEIAEFLLHLIELHRMAEHRTH